MPFKDNPETVIKTIPTKLHNLLGHAVSVHQLKSQIIHLQIFLQISNDVVNLIN